MEGLTILEALGLAAATHQHQIQVLSQVTQGSLGIFIKDPAVGTKGHLFPSPTNGQGLPLQAIMVVEVHQ